MAERRLSLPRLLRDVHSAGLDVHKIEATPDGYRLTTAPRAAVVSGPDPDADDLAAAREKLERARENRRAANGH